MFLYIPLLRLDIQVERPGSWKNPKDWVRPRVTREEGVTFLSAGPWEVAWCRLEGDWKGTGRRLGEAGGYHKRYAWLPLLYYIW